LWAENEVVKDKQVICLLENILCVLFVLGLWRLARNWNQVMLFLLYFNTQLGINIPLQLYFEAFVQKY